MRILHLLDHPTDDGAPDGAPEGAIAAVALLQRHDLENEHRLVCFGPVNTIERLRHFGASADARIGTASSRKSSALRALGPIIDRLGPFGRVQPWSVNTQRLALALALQREIQPLPPAPADAPIDPALLGPGARAKWRQRLGLAEDEIAITLLDQDLQRSSAGAFGLTLAPMSCAIQNRKIVGFIPEIRESPGATRAARYAGSADDAWRVECLSAPQYAIAIASDAVLCPNSPDPNDLWVRYASSRLALRCALAVSVPVITGAFDHFDARAPQIEGAIVPHRAGRVGIVSALNAALTASTDRANAGHPTVDADSIQHDPQRWVERWRSVCPAPASV